jgi:Lon protease-like protein
VVREAEGLQRGDEACVAPLFPLPNVFLFPGARMPLHVFEPRYRQMVGDLLDGSGRLVLGTVLERQPAPVGAAHGAGVGPGCAAPAVLPIGGLGEIVQHERLPDGRYYILVVGLGRVCIVEAPSNRLYRRVRSVPAPETPVCPSREPLMREKLVRAVLQRCRELQGVPADAQLSQLADMLLIRMQLPQSVLEPLYCELDVERRILGALREHARRPCVGGDGAP